MSLLLEALKKAALEKQNKVGEHTNHAPEPARTKAPEQPTQTPSADTDQTKAPQTAEAPAREAIPEQQTAKPEAASKKFSTDDPSVPDTIQETIDSHFEQAERIEAETAAQEADTQEQEVEDEDLEQTEKPEEVQEDLFDDSDQEWDEPENYQFEGDDSVEELDLDEYNNQQEVEQETQLSAEDPTIALQKANEELAETARAEQAQRDADEQEEIANEAKTVQAEKQKEITRRENRIALDNLLKSGEAVAKRAKHRSVFLYAMLIMTALGGILSYYFYLLANSSIAELQQLNPEFTFTGPETSEPAATKADISLEPAEADTTNEDSEAAAITIVSRDEQNTGSTDTAGDGIQLELVQPEVRYKPFIPQTAATQTTEQQSEPFTLTSSSGNKPAKEQTIPGLTKRTDTPPSAVEYIVRLAEYRKLKNPQEPPPPGRVIAHHKAAPASVNKVVQQAYNALQARQYDKARADYMTALDMAPDNRDALLGAATVAVAQNRQQEALTFYQRRLSTDPNDSLARAGMLAITNRKENSVSVNNDIDTLLASNPESAYLHFLKGINYAATRKWREAQSAFFKAFELDNQNPDYAYNLAISLDHLRQPEQARRFYKDALELAQTNGASFSEADLQRRIDELDAAIDG